MEVFGLPEEEGSKLFQKADTYIPLSTASYPRRPDTTLRTSNFIS
jgi:hypothetical protein